MPDASLTGLVLSGDLKTGDDLKQLKEIVGGLVGSTSVEYQNAVRKP